MTGGRRGQGGSRGTSPAEGKVNSVSTGRGPGKETLIQRLESQPSFARPLDTPTTTKTPLGAEPGLSASDAAPVSQADDAGQALPEDVLAREHALRPGFLPRTHPSSMIKAGRLAPSTTTTNTKSPTRTDPRSVRPARPPHYRAVLGPSTSST